MTAGPYTVLSGVTLTPTERASGFTADPTGAGPDVYALLAGSMEDLYAAQTKLSQINAVLPAGANKTALAAQLALLAATS